MVRLNLSFSWGFRRKLCPDRLHNPIKRGLGCVFMYFNEGTNMHKLCRLSNFGTYLWVSSALLKFGLSWVFRQVEHNFQDEPETRIKGSVGFSESDRKLSWRNGTHVIRLCAYINLDMCDSVSAARMQASIPSISNGRTFPNKGACRCKYLSVVSFVETFETSA